MDLERRRVSEGFFILLLTHVSDYESKMTVSAGWGHTRQLRLE